MATPPLSWQAVDLLTVRTGKPSQAQAQSEDKPHIFSKVNPCEIKAI